MSLGKQAKILTDRQISLVLDSRSRYPIHDHVMVLLSIRAGLRAKEIASLTWSMVTDAEGNVSDVIAVTNGASKGKRGGRGVPMCNDLIEALRDLPRV